MTREARNDDERDYLYDALRNYLEHVRMAKHVRTAYWEVCRQQHIPTITFATAGWDPRPRGEHPVPWVSVETRPDPTPPAQQQPLVDAVTASPAQVAQHLQGALDWIRNNRELNPANAMAPHVMSCRVKRLGLDDEIHRRLGIFKIDLPSSESDHVLNIAYSLLAGGTCLEHLELRRHDEVYLNALGAQRIPDPTTAGDFCRRFETLHGVSLMETFNRTRIKVWQQQLNYKSQWGWGRKFSGFFRPSSQLRSFRGSASVRLSLTRRMALVVLGPACRVPIRIVRCWRSGL